MELNVRPVPIPDPVTQFFWDSAKRGKLSVQGFEGTDILQHPPSPVPEVPGGAEGTPDCRRGERTRDPVRVHDPAPAVPSRFRRCRADDHRTHRARRRPGRADTHQHRRSRSGRAAVWPADGGGLRTTRRVRAAAVSAPPRWRFRREKLRSPQEITPKSLFRGPALDLQRHYRSPCRGATGDRVQPDLRQIQGRVQGVQPCHRFGDVGGPYRVHLERHILQHVGSTGPGVTMWTLMPSRSTSCANAPANAFMPAFDAEYAVLAIIGSWAADDEMNTNREPAFICGSAAEVTTKHESRLAEMVAFHCSKVCLRRRFRQEFPTRAPADRSRRQPAPQPRTSPGRSRRRRHSERRLPPPWRAGFLTPRCEEHVVAELSEPAAAFFSDAAAAAGDQSRTHTAPFSAGVGPMPAATVRRSAARDRPR